ncbi:MAG: hypothetical protein J6E46_01985 [Faecalicoccus sp.]|nr:hypothetical protein [Faecalicoccus sp.]
MDEMYFYRHLHEIMTELERDSVIVVPEKVNAMKRAEAAMKKMFPDAKVVMTHESEKWTRDQEITVNMKEIYIDKPQEFLDAVREADYIEFYPGNYGEMQLMLGFRKVKITKEEYLNGEF